MSTDDFVAGLLLVLTVVALVVALIALTAL